MINYKLSNGKGAFTQWDTGQYLIPINPPSSAEYFLAWYGSDTGSANQLVVEDGHVLIPDKVLQESGTIKVYCRNCVTGEFTAHSPIINIKSADKPDGYIADDTDFAEYIAKVKDYIDDSLSGKVGYAEYIDDVLYLYDTEDKENLIASIKIEGGSGGGISESKCKEIIENYGYATTESLSVYAKSADLAKVAKSGSYEDLSDKPDIPDAYDDTALRTLVNLHSTELETQAGDIDKLETGKQDKGDYALNSDIPTKTSELTNDSGFIDSSYHDSTKQNTLTDSDKQAIADLHEDAFTSDYQSKVDTMYSDWTATDTALTALEGVI